MWSGGVVVVVCELKEKRKPNRGLMGGERVKGLPVPLSLPHAEPCRAESSD